MKICIDCHIESQHRLPLQFEFVEFVFKIESSVVRICSSVSGAVFSFTVLLLINEFKPWYSMTSRVFAPSLIAAIFMVIDNPIFAASASVIGLRRLTRTVRPSDSHDMTLNLVPHTTRLCGSLANRDVMFRMAIFRMASMSHFDDNSSAAPH